MVKVSIQDIVQEGIEQGLVSPDSSLVTKKVSVRSCKRKQKKSKPNKTGRRR